MITSTGCAVLLLVSAVSALQSGQDAFFLGAVHTETDLREDFLDFVNSQLRQLRSLRCGDAEVLYHQYCDYVQLTVLPCPSTAALDFYREFCAVDFVAKRLLVLPPKEFKSLDSAAAAVGEVFDSVPPEVCGHNTSDHCPRNSSVCDRSVSTSGSCIPVERICGSDPNSERCTRTAQVYLLKKRLLDYLTTTNAYHDTEGHTKSKDWLILTIVIGAFLGVCIIVLVFCILILRIKSKRSAWKKQRAEARAAERFLRHHWQDKPEDKLEQVVIPVDESLSDRTTREFLADFAKKNSKLVNPDQPQPQPKKTWLNRNSALTSR